MYKNLDLGLINSALHTCWSLVKALWLNFWASKSEWYCLASKTGPYCLVSHNERYLQQKWKKPLHEWPFSRVRVGSSRELPLVGNGFLYAQPRCRRVSYGAIRQYTVGVAVWRRLLTKGSLWGLTGPLVSTLSPWKLEQMAQLSLGLYPTFWGYISWQYLKLQCLGLVQKVCSSSAC